MAKVGSHFILYIYAMIGKEGAILENYEKSNHFMGHFSQFLIKADRQCSRAEESAFLSGDRQKSVHDARMGNFMGNLSIIHRLRRLVGRLIIL